MNADDPRSAEYKRVWAIPEVQALFANIKIRIELAFHSEYCRGVEDAFAAGQRHALQRVRKLPRFTFKTAEKDSLGYVSVNAIDAELWKLGSR
ncbi:hypothetical protein AHiyo6_00410 [Arthrobacter sp. Hiyo6]|nr:hypothetical protein AHiyo6_00410 [Arthrobacter sp. Hiyo6]